MDTVKILFDNAKYNLEADVDFFDKLNAMCEVLEQMESEDLFVMYPKEHESLVRNLNGKFSELIEVPDDIANHAILIGPVSSRDTKQLARITIKELT
jgi:hypothetical protein